MGKVTKAAFVDLSAAYDTVNHRLLLKKVHIVYDTTKVHKLGELLKGRRLYVTLQGRNSK